MIEHAGHSTQDTVELLNCCVLRSAYCVLEKL
jgi:hypothetical protein